ncbi:MAG: ribonuclease J [Candidatus Yanofskybacteria bacterium]|nr:ribonuclease J [Candidatus Yanofskybacteria bacterium]
MPEEQSNNSNSKQDQAMSLEKQQSADSMRIIPLGGLGEVGRNMMVLDYNGKIIIIDMGFRMPEEDMPGIDYIIPNISSLRQRAADVLGVVFTHGHYDHMGAVPYLVKELGNPPLFAGPLARAIILKRQVEFPNQPKLKFTTVQAGKRFRLGPFELEPFPQNHNIPDNFGYVIRTKLGAIIHTSDFKFDEDPVNEPPTDFEQFKRFGKERVLLLMSDSTNAEQPNHSMSERIIMNNLEEIFKNCKGRIISATFASLLNRVQQMITLSEKYGRRVVVEGHSMKMNVEISRKLGYMRIKPGTLIKSQDISKYPDEKITVLGTGAQGEERAVLMRIVTGEHRNIRIQRGDTVIFSSSVIPGNERTVQFVKDQLYRLGAHVFHYKMMDIHASGHANQDELKELIHLVKPKFFVPIHGQFSMLVNHALLAREAGIPDKNVVVAENGNIINLTQTSIALDKKRVPSNYIMVDGLGVGDVGEVVLRDRQNLASDGMFVIVAVVDRQTGAVRGSPDIISRGFIYLRESKDLLRETRKRVVGVVNKSAGSGGAVNWVYVRDNVRNTVSDFLFEKTQRRPMVLPVIIEV